MTACAAIVFPADFSAVLVQPLSATPRLEVQGELLSDPGASGQFIQPIAAALQNFVSRQLAAGVPGKLVAQSSARCFAWISATTLRACSRMRAATLATPHGWALQAYVELIARGRDLVAVLPAVGMLSRFGALRFRLD